MVSKSTNSRPVDVTYNETMRIIQARSQEFAAEEGCFGGWKQHQTILTQILIGPQSD